MYIYVCIYVFPKEHTRSEGVGGNPFDRTADFGFGDGFHYHTQNHLLEKFGFANICVSCVVALVLDVLFLWIVAAVLLFTEPSFCERESPPREQETNGRFVTAAKTEFLCAL